MAFVTIPSTWTQVGKALKKELFDYIKNNFDDHETRINSIEQGINKVEVFNGEVIGYISNYSVSELVGIGTYRASQSFNIDEAKIIILNSSSSPTISSNEGILEVDVEKSQDNGVTWDSIFTVRPKVDNGISATGSESGAVTFSDNAIAVDDLIRLNVTSKKDSQGSFLVSIFGTLS